MKRIENRNWFRIPVFFVLHVFVIGPYILSMVHLDVSSIDFISVGTSAMIAFIASWVYPFKKMFLPINEGGSY